MGSGEHPLLLEGTLLLPSAPACGHILRLCAGVEGAGRSGCGRVSPVRCGGHWHSGVVNKGAWSPAPPAPSARDGREGWLFTVPSPTYQLAFWGDDGWECRAILGESRLSSPRMGSLPPSQLYTQRRRGLEKHIPT